MKVLSKISTVAVLLLLMASCSSVLDSSNHWFRDINVCRRMTGDVLVYPVFVEMKKGEKWIESDRKEYVDSLNAALDWLEQQAAKESVKLSFTTVAHPKVINKGLPGKSIKAAHKLLNGGSAGFAKFNKHYDGIAKKVSPGVEKEEVNKPFVAKIKNKERLIAKLRNAYSVESVVLMYVHKPEDLDNIYKTLNSLTNKDVEYMVTTFKSPTVIAYQILELFGAAPLMYSQSKKKELESHTYVKENFPNDIMANLGKVINELEIGAYTKYLIGWQNDFKEEYKKMYSQRKVLVK